MTFINRIRILLIIYCKKALNFEKWGLALHSNSNKMKYMFTNTRRMVVFLSLVCLCMTTVSKASTLPFSVLMVGTPSNNISFEVSVIHSKAVILSWESAPVNEDNYCHYEIEQSFDNVNFKTVGIVLDGFDIKDSNKKSYKFKDDNVFALKDKTVVYYRLKKVDANGNITSSDVMTVKLDKK
jgi:hypothetical protein